MPGSDVTPKKRAMDEESHPPLASVLRHRNKKQLVVSSSSSSPPNHTNQNAVDSNTVAITVSDIVERAQRIFRQHDDELDVIQLPCLSARLFACYTLAADIRASSNPTSSTTSLLCSTRFEQSIRHIRPLLPFLSALVRVELMSLRQDETLKLQLHNKKKSKNNNNNNNKEAAAAQATAAASRFCKVQFSGFDCSSTKPPSDTQLGSHVHRQRCTDALVEALEQARVIQSKLAAVSSCSNSSHGIPQSPMVVTQDDNEDDDNDNNSNHNNSHKREDDRTQQEATITTSSTADTATEVAAARDLERLQIVDCLQAMINFFQDLMKTPKSPFVTACAQSVHASFHAARIVKAMDLYRHEFATLLQSPSILLTPGSSLLLPRSKVLFVHQKLVSFLAQDIRYQLRILFNPAPYNAVDRGLDQRYSKRSRVPQLIQLYSSVNFVKGKNNKKKPAPDDTMLSCVVSTALQRIYDYFGRDVSLHLDQSYATSTIPSSPISFCQSAASLRGLVDPVEYKRKGRLSASSTTSNSSTTSSALLLQEDLQMVVQDVKQAYMYLSATRAARFLLDLLKADGVDEAIHAVGGWSTIEHHAQLLCHYSSFCCPEDEHFVLLAHVPLFVQVLEDVLVVCGDCDNKVAQCQKALQDVFRRFKCGDTGRIRKRFPQIAVLANIFEDLTSLSQFPVVQSTITMTTTTNCESAVKVNTKTRAAATATANIPTTAAANAITVATANVP